MNFGFENAIIEDTESLFYDVSAAMREPLDKLDVEETFRNQYIHGNGPNILQQ